jgi:uncharacterized protein YfaP (DUF2135 family)
MKIRKARAMMVLFSLILAAALQFVTTDARAQSSYFSGRGCTDCHSAPVAATCAGCHQHSGTLTATKNKTTSYAPGETVTITLTASGARSGWVGVRLYDQSGAEIARSAGSQSGMGGAATYPAVLSAPAPATGGTYTWRIAYFGNINGTGTGDVHGEKSVSVAITVASATADTTPPTLNVSALADGSSTNKVTLNVSGTAADAGGLQSVTVNGQPVTVGADGSFSTALNLVAGSNAVTVIAADKAGNETTNSRTVTYDPTAPVLAITAPADNSTSVQSFVTIAGTVNENSTVSVRVNDGSPQAAAMSGTSFSVAVNLVSGINTIDIAATDLAGNVISAKRTVTYSAPDSDLTLAVTEPVQDVTTGKSEMTIRGNVTDASGAVKVTVKFNGRSYAPKPSRSGSFAQKITFPRKGTYKVTVTATDIAGNTATATRNVIYRQSGSNGRNRDDYDD